jgi:quercetin dioxygenase-like cupin family protein
MRIEIKEWHFVRKQQASQIPAQGFYIAQLRSGRIVTQIGGKSETRQAGDFWTIDAGESMSVTLPQHSQSAQLQTVAITPGP